MRVPSRSRKTTGDFDSSDVMLETGDQFLSRHRGGAKFAHDDRAGVIGDFSGFGRSRLASECESEKRDSGVACAGNVENLARFRWNVMWPSVFLKKQHAILAESD